jgi:glycerol uptake facilitator-like aquaporin
MKLSRDINPRRTLISIINNQVLQNIFFFHPALLRNINNNTTLGPNTSIAQGVFLEMFFTAQLVFVVLMLAAEKSRDTFLAPIGIGLFVFVALIPGKEPPFSLLLRG